MVTMAPIPSRFDLDPTNLTIDRNPLQTGEFDQYHFEFPGMAQDERIIAAVADVAAAEQPQITIDAGGRGLTVLFAAGTVPTDGYMAGIQITTDVTSSLLPTATEALLGQRVGVDTSGYQQDIYMSPADVITPRRRRDQQGQYPPSSPWGRSL